MGRGGPWKRNCTFCKSMLILQTPDLEKKTSDVSFPCLAWSPPMYSKSWPSYILNVSFGSQVSRICRSKKFRISWNLKVSEPGDLDIWKFGNLGIWILSKTVRFTLCFRLLQFYVWTPALWNNYLCEPCLWESKGWIEKVWWGCANLNHWVLPSMNSWVPECVNPWILECLNPSVLSPGDFESWRFWILGSRCGNLSVCLDSAKK